MAQVVGGITIPEPYELWADGVFSCSAGAVLMGDIPPSEHHPLPPLLRKGRRRIAHRPVWISGLGETVDTKEPLVQLSYYDISTRLQTVWLSRGQITDHGKLLALGQAGLPFDSVNAKEALVWLREVESLNGPTMPLLQVGHRSGPYVVDGKMGWLIGRQWIGTGTPLQSDPRNNQRYVTAYAPHGSYESWLERWREVREQGWVCRFLVSSSFAAPLLRLLKCRSFIVHHWGQSGAGKTAISVFALSAWGNPELLYSSLNRTEISVTEIFRHVTDLPVLYDEKQVSTVRSDALIYSVCTGTGRERGTKEGGLRQDKPTWLTIARTTGEVPLIADGDVGGQFNRVLQIHSPSFTDHKQAEALYPFSNEHHGHAGPFFLKQVATLLDQPNGLSFLRQQFKEMKEALVNRIGADTNHAGYAALIALAQTLAETWLLNMDPVAARERALDDAMEVLRETAPKTQLSYAERALGKLRDHWVSNRMLYVDSTTAEGREQADRVFKMVGIEADFGMVYIPHEAHAILASGGYSPERVWRDFHALGWLMTDPGTQSPLTQITLRRGKSPDHPVYVIRAEIFFRRNFTRPLLQLVHSETSA